MIKIATSIVCTIAAISIAQYLVDATPTQAVVIGLAAIWSTVLNDRVMHGRRG
jgi:hypothetical protein